MPDALVLRIHPWQGDLHDHGLLGSHEGNAKPIPDSDVPTFVTTQLCSSKVSYSLGKDGLIRVECASHGELFCSGLHLPDFISQWCWTVARIHMWQTSPFRYEACRKDKRYKRFLPRPGMVGQPVNPQWPVLIWEEWQGTGITMLSFGLMEGDTTLSYLHAFASVLECTREDLAALRETIDGIRSSTGWAYTK